MAGEGRKSIMECKGFYLVFFFKMKIFLLLPVMYINNEVYVKPYSYKYIER